VGTQPRLRVTVLYLLSRCSNFFEEILKFINTVLILEIKFLVPLDFDKKGIGLINIIITS